MLGRDPVSITSPGKSFKLVSPHTAGSSVFTWGNCSTAVLSIISFVLLLAIAQRHIWIDERVNGSKRTCRVDNLSCENPLSTLCCKKIVEVEVGGAANSIRTDLLCRCLQSREVYIYIYLFSPRRGRLLFKRTFPCDTKLCLKIAGFMVVSEAVQCSKVCLDRKQKMPSNYPLIEDG